MREHGSFTLHREGNLVVAHAFEAWNDETATRYCREFREQAEAILPQPWSCLVNLREWEIGIPAIWDRIDEFNLWAKANNQICEAVVSTQWMQQELVARTYQVLDNVESKLFETEEAARAWLLEKGFGAKA